MNMQGHALRVTAEVDALTAGWRAAPPVIVVDTPADLPIPAPDDVRGLYLRGKVFVVARQPLPMVARTLAHELLGHHGLRQHLGRKAWPTFMTGIQRGARSGDATLQRLRADVRYWYEADRGDFTTRAESDEIAAAAVEEHVSPRTGLFEIDKPLRRRAAAAVGHFKREGMHMDAAVTHDQLLGALLTAQERMRHGGRLWGLFGRLHGWYSSRMSKPWHEKPLISVAESEAMLKAAKYQESADTGFKIFLELVWIVVAFFGGIFLLGYGILGPLFK